MLYLSLVECGLERRAQNQQVAQLSQKYHAQLQDALVLATSGRLELGDNILRTL